MFSVKFGFANVIIDKEVNEEITYPNVCRIFIEQIDNYLYLKYVLSPNAIISILSATAIIIGLLITAIFYDKVVLIAGIPIVFIFISIYIGLGIEKIKAHIEQALV